VGKRWKGDENLRQAQFRHSQLGHQFKETFYGCASLKRTKTHQVKDGGRNHRVTESRTEVFMPSSSNLRRGRIKKDVEMGEK